MRVLLINPPSPEQLGSPLLGLQYVAASLLARGCEVRVIDAADAVEFLQKVFRAVDWNNSRKATAA